jgi:CheY-like chemotaxis protein/DNA-binding XRE family transcriptional regulator
MEEPETLEKKFGSAIRVRRRRLGVSQEELAERAGLHRTYVADIERGARNPSLHTIDRLARAFDVSIASLFGPLGSDEPPAPAAAEILLVEDNEDDVILTLRAFRRARLTNPVRVMTHGAQALTWLRDRALPLPRLVLLDLGLPDMDGLEVLQAIRAEERTRDLAVVPVTVSREPSVIEACRSLDVQAYLTKPLDFASFSLVVQHFASMTWTLQ